jgi:hypothetical protein
MFLKQFFLVFSIIIFSFTAQARWITEDEAAFTTLISNSEINIKKDGQYEEISESKWLIQNQSGRDALSSYFLVYNGAAERVKILEAYTIYNGTKYDVPMSSIEDKPLASSASGFDQKRQILISFPKAEIGAQVYLKYTSQKYKVPVASSFANMMWLNSSGCNRDFRVNVTSELPIYTDINDPSNVLATKIYKENNITKFEAKLTKQICQDILAGSEQGIVSADKYTSITISSSNDWQDIGKKFAAKYIKVLEGELPEIFMPIYEEAKKEKNLVDQINLVIAKLNEKIRYMSDTTTVDGGYFPRDLALVAKFQEADCKEYSVITTMILRKLGYKADVALVYRGEGVKIDIRKLPFIGEFNHAIVKMIDETGKVYWIDPTNMVAMVHGIFPDIANKTALVLSSVPSYERTSNIDYKESVLLSEENIAIVNGSAVNHQGSLLLKNEAALIFSGIGLFQPEEAIKNIFFKAISGENIVETNRKKFEHSNLNSRIVNDLKFEYEYELDHELLHTNLNSAIKLRAPWVDELTNNVEGQLSDIYIGQLSTKKKIITFKNVKIKSIENLNYKISTPWLDIQRECFYRGKDAVVMLTLIYKKNFITSAELQSELFKKLKIDLYFKFKNIALLIEN